MTVVYNTQVLISKFTQLNPFQRSLASASAGFAFYGTWAYLVNSMHGMAPALKAACVQGSYSFSLTLTMTLLIEGLYRQLDRLLNVDFVVVWGTIVLVCAIIFGTSWWINAMAGTPEIFNTVILGYVIGGTYTITYVHGLARGRAFEIG